MSSVSAPRSPFEVIHEVTDAIVDVAQQQTFLQALTLDDWVTMYRLSQAAFVTHNLSHEQMFAELTHNGMHKMVSSIVGVMAENVYGEQFDWTHEINNYRFALIATLEQSIVQSLWGFDDGHLTDMQIR